MSVRLTSEDDACLRSGIDVGFLIADVATKSCLTLCACLGTYLVSVLKLVRWLFILYVIYFDNYVMSNKNGVSCYSK